MNNNPMNTQVITVFGKSLKNTGSYFQINYLLFYKPGAEVIKLAKQTLK